MFLCCSATTFFSFQANFSCCEVKEIYNNYDEGNVHRYFFILSTSWGAGKQLWFISTQTHEPHLNIYQDCAELQWGHANVQKDEDPKTDSPPPTGASDFWPYLGLLLWLSYPWSYLKEDEIWQVLGLAKAASWLHSGLPVGNPSPERRQHILKNVLFVAVLCASPLTCRANLACRQVKLEIWFFVLFCLVFWPISQCVSICQSQGMWSGEPDSFPLLSIQG